MGEHFRKDMESINETNLTIVFIIARFYPYKGGAEQNCYQLATRMAREGHNVTVLTTSASPNGSKLPSEERIRGVKVIRCRRWNKQLNLGFYPSLLPRLLKINADIVHVENGPGFIWHDFCVLVKKLHHRKTKFITTPHGPFLATWETYTGLKRFIGEIGKRVMWLYSRLLWSWLWDIVIQVNPHQYKWLVEDYRVEQSAIHLLPNGINTDMVIASKPKPKEKTVGITFTGRISKYKGVHKVLYALKEIESLRLPLKFYIMGKVFDQDVIDLIEQLGLEKQVEFVDRPSDEERDRILTEKSQIHILPSQWEATGIVLIEAMAKGNALITTNQNEGASMLIEEGVNGFTYDYENTLDLAEIITQLVRENDLREEMIKLNLIKAHRFTWDAIFPEYLKIIQKE